MRTREEIAQALRNKCVELVREGHVKERPECTSHAPFARSVFLVMLDAAVALDSTPLEEPELMPTCLSCGAGVLGPVKCPFCHGVVFP